MFVLLIKKYFSIQQLTNQRIKFQHKICYKNDYVHLKLKSTPTKDLATRLMRDGKFLTLYRNSHKFYFKTMYKNVRTLAENNEFKNLFFQYQSFTDFNRVLFWRLNSVNALFNLKKLKTRRILYYLWPHKRITTVLFWLKFILKLNKKDNNNNNPRLYKPLINFICLNQEINEIFHLKLKLYRLRLLRG